MAIAHLEGRRIHIRGTVQGVGFRPWVYRTAHGAGVSGRVRNDSSGVTIEAFGDEDHLGRFIEELSCPPPAARILAVDVSVIAPEPAAGFEIVASAPAVERRVSIPPDLAACPDCVAEILDPRNRRYRYPFTNCTNCGPRFTIAQDVPYDRATTTMAPFEMCPQCRREYEDVGDRRFHAQPNACPVCGPRLTLHAGDGARIHADDVLALAAQALVDGLIVAVKGIGGFHLACDATNDAAVRRLRSRKHRDQKPLAVMVGTIDTAAAIAVVGEAECTLLTGIERPIVLLEKRDGAAIAESVAPRNRMLGLMLPYSPLHHLLLQDAGRPLVMTSGNLSDEPIAFTNEDALVRLAGIADLFLLHDRAIATQCDDSVTAIITGRPAVLRRSRGYVPRSIAVARPFARPVLACGAMLKNTFCIGSGSSAWLGPHIGDLEHLDTYESYRGAIERMERFLEVRPEIVAHDMHPDYPSSTYAKQRPERHRIPVQHHHAHVASAIAEHGIEGPVIGVAYDGTGFGTDGTIWGGEILVADRLGFTRAATFRPIPLVGGDRAVREPWRIAAALVADAYGGNPPPEAWALIQPAAAHGLEAVRALIGQRAFAPLARGVGRYFDGFGALFLHRSEAAFEGQIALEWNQAADPSVTRTFPFELPAAGHPPAIDLRPAVRAAVDAFLCGESVGAISAAFHNTIAAATAEAVRRAVVRHGRLPVVATGGCFQNARLAEGVCAALAPEHRVLLHETVPPGDGGIALGQAVIADAIAGSY
ncbi:MAG TPA: carbamoyltransferase HypF [Vicinamibacterales bacterium]|nr:carbamoyltransferase HypF [Vicinamibacterales bacterium]